MGWPHLFGSLPSCLAVPGLLGLLTGQDVAQEGSNSWLQSGGRAMLEMGRTPLKWPGWGKELTGHDTGPYKSADPKSIRMDSAHQPLLSWHL